MKRWMGEPTAGGYAIVLGLASCASCMGRLSIVLVSYNGMSVSWGLGRYQVETFNGTIHMR